MSVLNLNNANALYYGNTLVEKLYKGDVQLYPYVPVDPYLNDVVLYLKGDGTEGSTNIIDSSSTEKIITIFGDTRISTTKSKYGYSSIFFNSGAINIPFSLDFDFKNSNFTIETWAYLTNNSLNSAFFQIRNNPTTFSSIGLSTSNSGNFLRFVATSLSSSYQIDYITSQSIPLNQWTHIAVNRNNESILIFINGILVATLPITFSIKTLSENIFISGNSANNTGSTTFLKGYLDSLRVTKACRYTANFNPETDTYLAY